jgi:hypothetical protein
VILSETTRALVGNSLPDGVSVHTLGERRLKDPLERILSDVDTLADGATEHPEAIIEKLNAD